MFEEKRTEVVKEIKSMLEGIRVSIMCVSKPPEEDLRALQQLNYYLDKAENMSSLCLGYARICLLEVKVNRIYKSTLPKYLN